MGKRIKLQKYKKKKAILDAAEEIIARNGFKAMTMDEVAKKADVAKGTLYLYFKDKNSLCAAVNARLNNQMNSVVKNKMNSHKTGSEKIIAYGTGIIEYCKVNPQKCKAATELYQMPLDDLEDINVQNFLQESNQMVQMIADAYRQGIDEGSIREDVDPIPTAIFNRMAFINAFIPTPEHKILLKINNFSQERYLTVAWNLINRSTHIKPSIRE
ncbi:TetR/AcrR family transcriptional regulator [Methanobacterium sp. ACI-7]|uniref:TetR/AcrR family transcriptional regulator n=1 Tax=unclassified Methanobacterium TaxID=2627676 RepID=UPI0039C05FF1